MNEPDAPAGSAAGAIAAAAANSTSTLGDFMKLNGVLAKMQLTMPDHPITKKMKEKVAQLALKMMEES